MSDAAPAHLRELLDSLTIPVPDAVPEGPDGSTPDTLVRLAPGFVTDAVARDCWQAWNPDVSPDAAGPNVFAAFRRMLRNGAALGFRIERFRDSARELAGSAAGPSAYLQAFEDVASAPGAVHVRISLSRSRHQSFHRDATAGSDTALDPLIRPLMNGLFDELGLVTPPIAIAADDALDRTEFRCEWNDLRLPPQRGLEEDRLLVDDTVDRLTLLNVQGEPARNPLTGAEFATIDAAHGELCRQAGLTTWDPREHLVLAIGAALRRAAAAFVNRSLLELFLFKLGEVDRELVELTEETLDRDRLVRTLRGLLDEGISIRDMPAVLEHLLESRSMLTMPDTARHIVFAVTPFIPLTETATDEWDAHDDVRSVRAALKRAISHRYTRGSNTLVVYLMDPDAERRLGQRAPLTAVERSALITAVRNEAGNLPPTRQTPVILTSDDSRRRLRAELEAELPQLDVLAYQELSPDLNIQPIARITPHLHPYDEAFADMLAALTDLEEPAPDAAADHDGAFAAVVERSAEVVTAVTQRVARAHPQHQDPLLEARLHALVACIFDGIRQIAETGATDRIDALWRRVAPLLPARASKFSDLFALPLEVAAVSRMQLAAAFGESARPDRVGAFARAAAVTADAAYRAARRYVEIAWHARFGGLLP